MYAEGAHEEMLEVSAPTVEGFARRHGYDFFVGGKATQLPAAWNKVPLLRSALQTYEEVVWFDCDLVVVDASEDFPPVPPGKAHSLVRHFEEGSEVPNSGVWRVNRGALPLLSAMLELEVFRDHGWWEQAALMTLMGYTVPPQGSEFSRTRCRCVQRTKWLERCSFMRVRWNSHPNYRAEKPKVVHCSYPDALQRLDVMKALVKDPSYDYPRYEVGDGG